MKFHSFFRRQVFPQLPLSFFHVLGHEDDVVGEIVPLDFPADFHHVVLFQVLLDQLPFIVADEHFRA